VAGFFIPKQSQEDTMSDATPEAPAPVAPVEPVTAPEPPTVPEPVKDPWADPEAARAEIEKLRKENASARVNAKATAAEEARAQLTQEFGKILGLVKDDAPVTPEHLTEQLTSAQTAAKAAALELAIYKTAATAKADPAALLDSRAFLDKVAGIDPTDSAALAAAISEATTSNPRFKVTQAAPVGGADFTGGSGPARTYTRAQLAQPGFYAQNRADILAAQREGRITS
jgi:uncharacterized protein (DUF736 family)